MKELYTSPEVKLINFLALERLATGSVDPDGFDVGESVASVDTEDISIDLYL